MDSDASLKTTADRMDLTWDSFVEKLRGAFAGRGEAPFLVLALRLAAESGYADAFSAITDGLLLALTARDHVLVRGDDARLVALVPGADPDAPRRLVTVVYDHLVSVRPVDAGAVLRAVDVLVIPDGEPFASPDDLLAYVFT